MCHLYLFVAVAIILIHSCHYYCHNCVYHQYFYVMFLSFVSLCLDELNSLKISICYKLQQLNFEQNKFALLTFLCDSIFIGYLKVRTSYIWHGGRNHFNLKYNPIPNSCPHSNSSFHVLPSHTWRCVQPITKYRILTILAITVIISALSDGGMNLWLI